MKRKVFFGVIAILLIAVVAAWNVSLNSQQNKEFSSLELENVEALSAGEGTSVTSCLGLWSTCTINGATSKAPLVMVEF
jgi:hypothetical protein